MQHPSLVKTLRDLDVIGINKTFVEYRANAFVNTAESSTYSVDHTSSTTTGMNFFIFLKRVLFEN